VDLPSRRLDLAGAGTLDLRLLSPLVAAAALSGRADVDVTAGGTIEQPSLRGSVDVRDGTLRLRDIPQALTAIEARLAFDETRVRVEQATGVLGGGALALAGEASLRGLGVDDLRLDLRGRDVALRYPAGLKTRLDAELALTGRPGAFRLSGEVRVVRGLYDLEVAIAETVSAPVAAPTGSPLLRAVALAVAVRLENPVLVRNSLAELEVTGSLTARGDMETPAPFGRLEFRPGGKVFMQGRDFKISGGSLEYKGTWDPELALVARRERVRPDGESRDYDITVSAQGPLESPRLQLTSDPSLSEREILSLIATGRRESAALDSGAWIVGGQAATLLSGRVTRGVARTLGLDEVTVRPDLVARETDPSARFTFGKELVRQVSLVYSVGLSGPESRFFQLLGRPVRNATALVQRADEGIYTYGAGQKFAFGAAPAPPGGSTKEEMVLLSDVRMAGELPLTEPELRRLLHARPGRRASPFELQEDADRLRQRLRREGHLEAEVGVSRDGDVAVFRLIPGPRYAWRVLGMDRPPELRRVVLGALYEEEALERGRERLLEELRERGHPRATVGARAEPTDGGRLLVFTAEPGPRLRLGKVRFPGARVLSPGALLHAAGGPAALLTRPQAAVEAIRAAYRERHYLAARVELPRVREDGGRVSIEVPIQEGPPARLIRVGFEGTTVPEGKLAVIAALETGGPYDFAAVEAATRRLRDHYLGLGFPAVRVRPEARAEGADVAILFKVIEGERTLVDRTVITGLSRTREGLVRRQLGLRPDQPLDPRRLGAAERRLNALGTFSRVAVTASEEPGAVQVLVEEGPAFTVGYDVRYDDAKGAGGVADGELRNLLGRGVALGGRYELAADLRALRWWFRVPALGPGGDLTGSAFRTEEDIDAEGIAVTQRRTGFQLQQSLRLPARWEVLLGYHFSRSLTLSPLFPAIPLNISGLDLSFLRETRDNLLDARRGSFLSANIELSPRFLLTDAPFVKGFAQASIAVPLAPALTWAQSYRLGLASGLGGDPLNPQERFFAGGASSLRGFATNSVGPPDVLGKAAGGDAVVVVNQELRYHHGSGLGAVVFYDGGNVYRTVGEMTFDITHTLGAGLRWASPVGLLRLDAGFPLALPPHGKRKPYRLYFSLGQAF
jgi:outer membrane protein insertion porin family